VPCTWRNLRSEHPQEPRKNRRELDSQLEADLEHSERIPAGWLLASRPPSVRTDLALVGRGSREVTRRMHQQRPQIRQGRTPHRRQAYQVGSKRTLLDSTPGKGHWSAETYLLQVRTHIGVHRCLQLATTESPPNPDQPPWVVRNLLVEELRTERSQLGLPLVQRRIHRGQAPSRLQAVSLHRLLQVALLQRALRIVLLRELPHVALLQVVLLRTVPQAALLQVALPRKVGHHTAVCLGKEPQRSLHKARLRGQGKLHLRTE